MAHAFTTVVAVVLVMTVLAAVFIARRFSRVERFFATGHAVQLVLDYDDAESNHSAFVELKHGLRGISFVTHNVMSANGRGAVQHGKIASLPDLRIIHENATVSKYASPEPWRTEELVAWAMDSVPGRGIEWKP